MQFINYVNNIKKEKKNVHEILIDLEDINNKKITTNLKVSFKGEGKENIKDIYIIMNKDMINNIKMDGNIQYFSDTTYYCIPTNVNN